MSAKVLFIVPYPLRKAPSQRFRVELFLPVLIERKIKFRVEGFFDEKTWNILYQKGASLQKLLGLLRGFTKRFIVTIFVVPQYDFIFIHREASPVGPPLFEWLIAKVWRKKIIYDFDDAIWMPDSGNPNGWINLVKAFWKIKYLCKWAHKVVGGNEFLCRYAANFNNNVVLIPTSVDTKNAHNQLKDQRAESRITIGWTGSHSTMVYLNEILPVLQRVASEFSHVEFVVISNKNPELPLANFFFVPWIEQSEITDLLRLNIGIMPLAKDKWSEGKCGFKLIQYMALGITAVASPVGVNNQIIQNKVDGFLCSTQEDWYQALVSLIRNEELRRNMGMIGRKKIETYYSIQANASSFCELFR